MTHYWLTDRKTGTQYIYHPGEPDHGSVSEDGINWDRPIDDDHLAQRQIVMGEIMAQAERDWEIKAERQRERDRLAAQQGETPANHIGNMETPEAAAERDRREMNLKAIRAMRKELNRKTFSEHLMGVLVCAMVAVAFAGCVRYTIGFIDQILNTVRAW